MSIYDMRLFSIEDVQQAWDDAATRIIPLVAIPPEGQQQIREYFIDILIRRMMDDNSFPEEPKSIDIIPIKKKGDN